MKGYAISKLVNFPVTYRKDIFSLKVLKIIIIRNNSDLNLHQGLNHKFTDLILYKEDTKLFKEKIKQTIRAGKITFILTTLRLPKSGKIITRTIFFEKQHDKLFAFVIADKAK